MFENYEASYEEICQDNVSIVLYDYYDYYRDDIKFRIKSISLDNFKSVKHGEIDLVEGHKPIPFSNEPSILGIYGQNGSGKTTLLGAINLLKKVVYGSKLPKEAASYIATDSNKTTVTVVFEIQSKGSDIVEYLTYTFSLKRIIRGRSQDCKVCDEKLTVKKVDYNGKLVKKSRILFDSNSSDPVKSCRKLSIKVSNPNHPEKGIWVEEEDIIDERNGSLKHGSSVLFGSYSISVLGASVFGDYRYDEQWDIPLLGSDYDYLLLLQEYVDRDIMIAGVAALNAFSDGCIPLSFGHGRVLLDDKGYGIITSDDEDAVDNSMKQLSGVLKEIIPGLQLHYDVIEIIRKDKKTKRTVHLKKELASMINIDYKADPEDEDRYEYEKKIRVFSERDGIKIPISEESEGIKRLIYEMDILVEAFNDPGKTAVIDEFDAGIYEYLLGEILELFERYGKGQLIFTSHNLRPLEVLSRKCICFTTTNRSNRYIKIKNLGKTNNLRDVYLRTIFADDREERLYERRKSYLIADAFRRAGMPK